MAPIVTLPTIFRETAERKESTVSARSTRVARGQQQGRSARDLLTCPTATVFDIGNTPTQIVLINTRWGPKYSHLRGSSAAEKNRLYAADPGRHTSPRTQTYYHRDCTKDYLELLKENTQDAPPSVPTVTYNSSSMSEDTTLTFRKISTLPPANAVGDLSVSPSFQPENTDYMKRLTKVYNLENEKYLKEKQYSVLLERQGKTGYYGANDLRRYRRYLSSVRRRGKTDACFPTLRRRSVFPTPCTSATAKKRKLRQEQIMSQKPPKKKSSTVSQLSEDVEVATKKEINEQRLSPSPKTSKTRKSSPLLKTLLSPADSNTKQESATKIRLAKLNPATQNLLKTLTGPMSDGPGLAHATNISSGNRGLLNTSQPQPSDSLDDLSRIPADVLRGRRPSVQVVPTKGGIQVITNVTDGENDTTAGGMGPLNESKRSDVSANSTKITFSATTKN